MLRVPVISLIVSSLLLAQEKTSYDDHILPIFEQSCLNCHNPDKTKGGLDLSNYAAAIKGGSSGKVVEPGRNRKGGDSAACRNQNPGRGKGQDRPEPGPSRDSAEGGRRSTQTFGENPPAGRIRYGKNQVPPGAGKDLGRSRNQYPRAKIRCRNNGTCPTQ